MNWLRKAGKFRRVARPRMDLVYELLESALPNFPCPQCDTTAIEVRARAEFDDEWPEARICEICKVLIPAERLEVFPDASRCAKCQNVAEPAELEYCPKCGAVMKVRQRGRTSTYQLTCTECRYVS